MLLYINLKPYIYIFLDQVLLGASQTSGIIFTLFDIQAYSRHAGGTMRLPSSSFL